MTGQGDRDDSAEELLRRAQKLQAQSASISEKRRLKQKRSGVDQISRQVSDTVETYKLALQQYPLSFGLPPLGRGALPPVPIHLE